MADQVGFTELLRRVRAGDNQAATEFFRRYEPAVRRVARIRLGESHLERFFDSEDICQSVFASFFVRAALGQYELTTAEDALNLLVAMSRKKVIDKARGAAAARRDFRREEQGSPGERQLAATAESPSQQVAGAELIAEFRRRLSADERKLADERAGGRDWNDIAAEWGGNAEALRKQLARAVDRVSAELGLDDGP